MNKEELEQLVEVISDVDPDGNYPIKIRKKEYYITSKNVRILE